MKIRAYDTLEEKFIEEVEILSHAIGDINTNDKLVYQLSSEQKDNEGREIFVGDILKVYDPDKKHQIQEVVFVDGAFCGYSNKKTCKNTLIDTLIRAHGVKVIGNIFTNDNV